MSTYRTPFKGEDLLECAGDATTYTSQNCPEALVERGAQ